MAHKNTTIHEPIGKVFLGVLLILAVVSLLSRLLTNQPVQKEMIVHAPAHIENHHTTVLSFVPSSSSPSPIMKKIGDLVPLDIMVDPGKNVVSFVKIIIVYDPTKLAPVKTNAFKGEGPFSSLLSTPLYDSGKISATLSIGPNPGNAITSPTKAASITFNTLAPTTDAPTIVTFGSDTLVLSLSPKDNASENVLSSTIHATVVIQ